MELTTETQSYPGDSKIEILRNKTYQKDGYTLFDVKMNMHVGTHIETMMHLSEDLRYIKDIQLEYFYGSATLISQPNEKVITWDEKYNTMNIEKIVLIHTGFDVYQNTDTYFLEHPILSESFIDKLIEKGIKVIGIDFPSPDYFPYLIHKKLFENEIFIIENLTNLKSLIKYESFIFSALPLKIQTEASPVRAVAIIKK
ncbi:Cyclase family protein [Alteracholeplasma palmae J233]|uniref:Cyclase family protein n=2 Tax=Acholeplasma palmae TaxID=38986 RepID=U4KJU9_ALTPJ|nr:Cyclase family protein [Alteracholeplasma palmae J233]